MPMLNPDTALSEEVIYGRRQPGPPHLSLSVKQQKLYGSMNLDADLAVHLHSLVEKGVLRRKSQISCCW